MSIHNTSPLRYPGGKTRACKTLFEILESYYDTETFDTVVSPFLGGSSFEFYLQSTLGYRIIGNDKFTPLANFWKMCKSKGAELCDMLYTSVGTVDKARFSEYRDRILGESDSLTQSFMFFIINRCSFSGSTLSGGFSGESSKKRFTTSSVDRVSKLDLSHFEIYNQDFSEFIVQHWSDDSNTLGFLDPPYYLGKESKLYGKNGDLHEGFDHEKLFESVKHKTNWMMTYNNCEYIRDLYKDFTIIETSWAYGMNKTKKSSEIIIIARSIDPVVIC